jgi:cell division inhibitor SulA/protein ImuA
VKGVVEARAGRARALAQLTQLPGVWRGGEPEHVVHPVVSTGNAALDRELPGGGWPAGTLSEVLHDGVGIGEVGFLAGTLAGAAKDDRLIAWVNAPHLPYAPALADAGIPLERCLVIRSGNAEEALWAAEQALRSSACGALLFWLPRVKNEYAWLRRVQMAAAAGRAIALYFRPAADESLSTPAHLRVVVSRDDGVFRIRIPKRRGPPLSLPLSLDLGHAARKSRSIEPAGVPLPAIPASRAVVFSVV